MNFQLYWLALYLKRYRFLPKLPRLSFPPEIFRIAYIYQYLANIPADTIKTFWDSLSEEQKNKTCDSILLSIDKTKNLED